MWRRRWRCLRTLRPGTMPYNRRLHFEVAGVLIHQRSERPGVCITLILDRLPLNSSYQA